MTKFIELTHSDLKSPITLNVDTIIMFMRRKDTEETVITLNVHNNTNALGVIETPEQINNLIKEVSNGLSSN